MCVPTKNSAIQTYVVEEVVNTCQWMQGNDIILPADGRRLQDMGQPTKRSLAQKEFEANGEIDDMGFKICCVALSCAVANRDNCCQCLF